MGFFRRTPNHNQAPDDQVTRTAAHGPAAEQISRTDASASRRRNHRTRGSDRAARDGDNWTDAEFRRMGGH